MSESTRRAAQAVHRRARRVAIDNDRPMERAVVRSLDPLTCELFESSLVLKYLDDWRMSDEMRWYRRNYGLHVGDELVLVEMHDHEWLAVGHFSADDVGAVFAPPTGTGVIGVSPGLTYAVTKPGMLIARYQAAEAGGDLHDTAGLKDSDGRVLGPFTAALVENTAGVDPDGGPQASWDGSQAPTYKVSGMTEDGAVRFNYNQQHFRSIGAGYGDPGTPILYPGSFFHSGGTAAHSGPFTWAEPGTPTPTTIPPGGTWGMRSFGFFVKPSSAQALSNAPFIGYGILNADTLEMGWAGWYFYWDPVLGTIGFSAVQGGDSPGTDFRVLGLKRTGLAGDTWYRVCVAYDTVVPGAQSRWDLIINGFVVDSVTIASHYYPFTPAVQGGLSIGCVQIAAGGLIAGTGGQQFGLVELDEIDAWINTVTPADEQAIAAAGPTGATTVGTVTLGAGAPESFPGAISSGLAPAGQAMVSDGFGGTTWDYVTTTVYKNGA